MVDITMLYKLQVYSKVYQLYLGRKLFRKYIPEFYFFWKQKYYSKVYFKRVLKF